MSAEKITELVDVIYPKVIENINSAIVQLNLQKVELLEQIAAIEYVQDQLAISSTNVLNSKGFGAVAYGPLWNVENLSDFVGSNYLMLATYISNNSFSVIGSPSFGSKIVCDCGVNGFVLREIQSYLYDGASLTTVTLVADATRPITGLVSIYDVVYEFNGVGWDSDATLIANNNAFLDSYGHLNTPLGTSGTFGLIDRLAKIDIAINIQQADKVKYESFITAYEPFKM
jgi:hypothetical protein